MLLVLDRLANCQPDRQLRAAAETATLYNIAPTWGAHALAEAVGVHTFALAGLVGTLHSRSFFFKGSAKIGFRVICATALVFYHGGRREMRRRGEGLPRRTLRTRRNVKKDYRNGRNERNEMQGGLGLPRRARRTQKNAERGYRNTERLTLRSLRALRLKTFRHLGIPSAVGSIPKCVSICTEAR